MPGMVEERIKRGRRKENPILPYIGMLSFYNSNLLGADPEVSVHLSLGQWFSASEDVAKSWPTPMLLLLLSFVSVCLS